MREAAALAVLVLSSGCNELPPMRYETDHLRIGTDFEGPVCAGTLHEFEEQVLFVEEAHDFQVQGKLELYLFKDSVGEWCGRESVPGCYFSHGEKRAYSTYPVARHEIVHAVMGQIHAGGSSFFAEGFAVDLTGEGSSFPVTYPSSNLGLLSIEVSHRTAGHFMRWLRSRYSSSELEDIMRHSGHHRSASHATAAFNKATGDDFHEVEQAYFETAPEFFAPFDIVEPPTVAAENGGWDIALDLNCEEIDTEGYDDEMWRRVRIEVTEPGYYVLVVTWPATATISLRRTEDLPVGDPIPNRPSWPIGDELFDAPEAWFPNVPLETWLDAGIYDIGVHVPGVAPTTAAVRIHPQVGPISELP
jgi:hypothetical protein